MTRCAPANPRWAVGCMTGTSLDGLDVALVQLHGQGLAMTARFVSHASAPLNTLAPVLRSMAGGEAHAPIDYLRAARQLGELHARTVAALCERHLPRGETLAFVAAHGQTIWHAPRDATPPPPEAAPPEAASPEAADPIRPPLSEAGVPGVPGVPGAGVPGAGLPGAGAGVSWQLFDPWPVARELGAPVVYDLRQADLIAGGEGAPITPIADWIMYRTTEPGATLVVNLGGICNVTLLDHARGIEAIAARDGFVCNLLLDGLVQRLFAGKQYDEDGRLAAQGTPRAAVRALLHAQAKAVRAADEDKRPASLGREQFTDAWLNELTLKAAALASPHDVLASAVAVVAEWFVQLAMDMGSPGRVILAGGSVRNAALVRALREQLGSGSALLLSDELGIPSEAREAMAFAVLGALSQDGVPITLPQVTGATRPGVLPGAGAWVFPTGFEPQRHRGTERRRGEEEK